jgi:hypothetical protein
MDWIQRCQRKGIEVNEEKKLHRKEMKQLGDLQEGERSRGGCSGRGGRSRNVSINKQLESDDMFAWY